MGQGPLDSAHEVRPFLRSFVPRNVIFFHDCERNRGAVLLRELAFDEERERLVACDDAGEFCLNDPLRGFHNAFRRAVVGFIRLRWEVHRHFERGDFRGLGAVSISYRYCGDIGGDEGESIINVISPYVVWFFAFHRTTQ